MLCYHFRLKPGVCNVWHRFDCNHVKMKVPRYAAHEYMNRKSFHSIIVQVSLVLKLINLFLSVSLSRHLNKMVKVKN